MKGGTPALVVIIAVLVLVVLFFGLGFGTGALASGPSACSNEPTCYTVTQGLEGSSWGQGFSFQVNILTVNQSNQPFVTSMLAGGESTSVTFGLNIYSTGDCGDTGRPTFDNGVGADVATWSISLGGQAFAGAVDGTSFPSTTDYQFAETSTQLNGYCTIATATGGDYVTSTWYQGGDSNALTNLLASHTLVLDGQYAPSTLSISMTITGTYCDGISGNIDNTACAEINPVITNLDIFPNGAWTRTATTTTNELSGQATITRVGAGPYYNGGTFSVDVTTGYGGASGYELEVQYGAARGGGLDSNFQTYTVPNEDAGATFTWNIPEGTGVNSTISGWNVFNPTLIASLQYIGSVQCVVDISPAYAPLTPVMTFSNTGTFTQPQPGSIETVTASVTASATSGPVTSITLWAFYLTGSESASTLPACGSQWITACQGSPMQLTESGNTTTGTYAFTVDPIAGSSSMGFEVTGFTSEQQGSPTTTSLVNILPSSCSPSQTGCGTTQFSASTWEVGGPIILSLIFILLGVLVAIYVPIAWIRVLAVVLPIALVIVLYALGTYTDWFSPGGILNNAVG